MTHVIDGRFGAGTVHILIVGVGHYEGGAHEDLPGVAAAVDGLTTWWSASQERLLEGRTLGSVRVLLAPEEGVEREYDLPTREAVCTAFSEWVSACRDAGETGMGFLFWVGHGGTVGSPGGPGHILYCTNWVGDRQDEGYQDAINWSETLQGINALCGKARMFCFIDSCRSPIHDPLKVDPALRGYRLNGEPTTFVLYSARPGGTAWSVDDAHQASCFPGGPLATCAILQALEHFGATQVDPTLGHFATPDAVRLAIKHRVERWAAWLAAEDGEEIAPPPVKFVQEQGDWFDEPMLIVTTPRAMLDVLPRAEEALNELACVVTGEDERQADAASTGKHWEIDVGRGSHQVRILNFPNGEAIFERRVHVNLPYHRLSRR